jgi:predicted ATPase
MTLTGLRLANFKAFGTSQRIPLRPITLVFGANSAGKSSLIHAFALAHHAVGTGELDTQRTGIGGEAIDLGGFRQYVHRRERERQVELGFELDPGSLAGRVAEFLRPARAVLVELAIGAGFASAQRTLFGDVARELDRSGGVRLERFALVVDGVPLLSMTARPGGVLRLDRLDHHHPVFREVFRAIVTLATTTQELREEDFEGLGEVLDALIPGITARPRGLFPRVEEDVEASAVEAAPAFLAVSRGRRREDLARAARMFLPGALRDLIGGVASTVEEEIRRLRYLGPLRSYPPRHLAFSQHHDPNWFAGGGYAWDVVRTREEIRRRVNEWLGDAVRLKTPYELVVRDLLPAGAVAGELPPKVAKALHDLAAALLRKLHGEEQPDLVVLAGDLAERLAQIGAEDPEETIPEVEDIVTSITDSEALAERWTRELVEARGEALQDLMLIDKRTGTPVSHRDVGIGVSQVLPVLVSAYASNGLFVAIEQPEIHLHPALQAELGDVFVQSALSGRSNSFLIETHSEHLILRILRRVRETTELELPDGLPRVRPEDISVLYVQPGREGAEVIHIPVTPDGEFERPWPEGFFAERAKELF